MTDIRATELLNQVKERLHEVITGPKYHLLVEPLEVESIEENRVVLVGGGQKQVEWLQDEFGSRLVEAFSSLLGNPTQVIIKPGETASESAGPQEPFTSMGTLTAATRAQARPLLNPRFTFDNFVVGPGNQFCYSAAKAVAERPGFAYNPLFVYADVGLGKTHILHSIGHRTLELRPEYRVIFVTSEKFTSDFIEKVRAGRMNEFHQRYRQCDLLLIDDIQFIAGKVETQMEFFHTFMSLVDAGKQIVVTADSPPQELKNIEIRLLSRFGSGLLVDIAPPEVETRLRILKEKVKLEGREVQKEILDFVAESVHSNVRELEGALIRLLAFSDFSGAKLTLEAARRVLADFVKGQTGRRYVSMEQIIDAVCEVFRVDQNLLMGRDRRKKVADARMVIMYLGRQYTNLTLSQIGEEVGGRDHSTVSHGVNKVAQAMDEDPYMQQMVQRVKRKLLS